jgi:hypothetical protein
VFVIILFCLLRLCRRCFRKSKKVRKFLRPFKIVIYLSPLLLDGNLQYFFFLMFTQTQLGFSLNPRDKIINVINYMLYFLIIFFSVTSVFLVYWLSKRLAKYLLDNWKTKLNGLLAHSLVNAIRMLITGGIHSLLRSSHLQLPLLLSMDVLYIVVLILSMKYWKAH